MRLNAGVRQKLAEAGINSEVSNEIDIIFTELQDPFTGLETEFLQKTYFNDAFNIPVSFYAIVDVPVQCIVHNMIIYMYMYT